MRPTGTQGSFGIWKRDLGVGLGLAFFGVFRVQDSILGYICIHAYTPHIVENQLGKMAEHEIQAINCESNGHRTIKIKRTSDFKALFRIYGLEEPTGKKVENQMETGIP